MLCLGDFKKVQRGVSEWEHCALETEQITENKQTPSCQHQFSTRNGMSETPIALPSLKIREKMKNPGKKIEIGKIPSKGSVFRDCEYLKVLGLAYIIPLC